MITFFKRTLSWILTPFFIIACAIWGGMEFAHIPGADWFGNVFLRNWKDWNDEILMDMKTEGSGDE